MNDQTRSIFSTLYSILFGSSLNTGLTIICAYLIYRMFRDSRRRNVESETFKVPPPLEKHNMTLDELKKYNGQGEDGRICIAVLGKVFDCSKGRRFYGPGGPYSTFAGKDATRALATFDVDAVKDDYDDHSDLTPSQRSGVDEWQMQFSERYDLVGDLVRPEELEESAADTNSGDKTESAPEKQIK